MTPVVTLSRPEIDELKARVDLVALFEHHGVPVQKIGRDCKALCPFHKEQTASLSLDREKGLYHCFGCGESGDALTFLQKAAGRTFAQALSELQQWTATNPSSMEEIEKREKERPFPFELMERVAEIWHQAFCERPEGLDYLQSRGLHDKEMLRLFRAGYCDGEQLSAITGEAERTLLQQVGLFNEKGREFFSRCVVFPLKDRHGRVVAFAGRSTLPHARVPHRFCAGTRTGVFHSEAACGSNEVILAEGVLDSLALYQAGWTNVMALGGTQGCSPALIEHLKINGVKKVTLCLDGDAAGRQAGQQLQTRLGGEGFAVRIVQLPDGEDPLSCPAQQLAACLQEKSAPASELAQRSYRKLSAAQGKLKVWVSVSHRAAKAEATVDLYSARSRRTEALALSRRVGLDVGEIEEWFFAVLNELEEQKHATADAQQLFGQVQIEPMTAEQRQAALAFLKQPDLVNAILADMEALGYMGEEEAKLLGYCVSVSRKLEKPMSAIFQSGSGAGKSYLAQVIQALTPPENVVFYSRLSQQALYHMPKDYLVHKLVELEERVGGEGCDYQIRALQSSSRLVQAIVVKDPATGQLFTKENEVLGPIAYIETTTSLRLNPENTSRCFEIPLDESPEQTRRIHERQRALKSIERLGATDQREAICEKHHHAQRLLEPIPVVIPYVHRLTFPDQWLRSRRDHDRFLHLIEVLAYLHQFQRPHKTHNGVDYVEATPSDYRWAYFLAHRVLRHSMDELSRWARELLTFFQDNTTEPLTRREVRTVLKWPDRRTREALEELAELEYLEVQRGTNNQFFFRLASFAGEEPAVSGLLHPDQLERLHG